ncbi:hypothetical protein OG304_06575 [Streptomyces sp. NBC_00160]|nr:hypothetical protein [Streptomyces sp. NBC_00160]MCX5303116.1 hypothetical protein [Streptomyces sp. NBC_00160]
MDDLGRGNAQGEAAVFDADLVEGEFHAPRGVAGQLGFVQQP